MAARMAFEVRQEMQQDRELNKWLQFVEVDIPLPMCGSISVESREQTENSVKEDW